MHIKLLEFKKIFTSPILYILLAVFIAFNSFTIISSRQDRSNLDVLNSLISRFGYKINSGMLSDFSSYYSSQIGKMNELSRQKTAKTYKSASDFINDDKNNESGIYTNRQLAKITRLQVIESYYNTARGIELAYKSLDIKKMGDEQIKRNSLSGEAAVTARVEYGSLAKRFARLTASGEEKNLFYYGPVYSMQTLLFGTVFGDVINEILILTLLMTCLSINFEFDAGAHSIAYATKRGRRLICDKLLASCVSCFIITATALGVTLAVYFCTFDYTKLWNVPIGSGFLNERMQMYIPWFSMTFFQYLAACIFLVFVCGMIFTALAFCIASLVKNNYIVFAIFVLLCVASMVAPQIVPKSSNFVFLTSFNPFILTSSSALWFMEKGPFADFRHYEVITVSVWSALLACTCLLCIKRFKKLAL